MTSRPADQQTSRPADQQTSRPADQQTSLAAAIQKLYQWQYGVRDPDDFVFQLYTLLQMANPQEFEKLTASFPAEAKAFKIWYESPDPVEFFKSHGVWLGPRKK